VHPLTFGRALSVGWSLYRYRWPTLLAVGAVFIVPAHVLAVLLNLVYGEAFLRWQQQIVPRLQQAPLPPLGELMPWEALALALIASLLIGFAVALAGAGLIHVIAWTYGGGRPSVGQAVGRTLARLPSLLGGMLIATLTVLLITTSGLLLVAFVAAVGGGGLTVFLALVAGVSIVALIILLTARWSLFNQSVMLDGAGAVSGLGRSWRLVWGSTWRVLGYIVALTLLALPFSLLAGGFATALFGAGTDWTTLETVWDPSASAGQVAASGVAALLVQPFVAAVMTVLYYDLRLKQGEALTPPVA
jgi:hypothetical protein